MSNVYIGQIVPFAFQFSPRGFAYCNGAVLPINQYTALFALIGTTYGGDGVTTFQLPNLGGRTPIGQFQSPGTSNYQIGQIGGTETSTLTTANLPPHTHALNAVQTKATTQAPAAGSLFARTNDGSTVGSLPEIYVPAGTAGTQVGLGGVGVTGSGTPFNNQAPYLAINYCIAMTGMFPTRN